MGLAIARKVSLAWIVVLLWRCALTGAATTESATMASVNVRTDGVALTAATRIVLLDAGLQMATASMAPASAAQDLEVKIAASRFAQATALAMGHA